MLKVITTVGTSIFENYGRFYDGDKINWNYIDRPFDGGVVEERNKREKQKIRNWISNVGDKSKISAEIKSILKLKDEKKEELDVYLLASYTVASYLAAEIIKELLIEEGYKVVFNSEYDVIKKLQVYDSAAFVKQGLINLINRIEQIASGYYDNIILNITGGYKGIVPYITIIGIINKCEIKYIYEDSEHLITIPQLPLSIDESIFDNYYDLLSQLDNGVDNYKDFKAKNFYTCDHLEKCGLIEDEDNIALLTPIGQILFNNYKSRFVWFYCSDEVFCEIKKQENIKKILKEKFFRNYSVKTQKKNGHLVYDDGNNSYRVFYFEENDSIYIYKTFEDHDEYERYLKRPFTNYLKELYLKQATMRKLKKSYCYGGS